MKELIMKNSRREILTSLLSKGERVDQRKFTEYRNISIVRNPIDTSEGSALASIGNSKVLASFKFDVATPYPDRPKEGVMITNSEFLQMANPHFESGPPGENSIELARVVDRGIRSAELIDTKSFFIEDGKVMALFLDLYVLDDSGNILDTAALAAAAALKETKIPKIEEGKIIRGEYSGAINPKTLPIATTFVKIGHYWVADPILEEEESADTKITITTTDEHVCSMQKSRGSLSKEELLNNINISFNIGKEIRKLI